MTARRRVLVLGAPFGGCDRAAEAVSEALLHAGAGLLTVETADFFKRFAPRLAALAALAHRTDAAFLPDGGMSVLELTRTTPDSPAVRELSSGAVAALESVVTMLEPAAVVSTHQVAGAAAAELRSRHEFVAASVVCDLLPGRLWAHPSTDLYFVASDEVRERASLHGVDWDRIAVTGVPCRSAFLEGRPRARTGTRLPVALVAPGLRPAARRELLADLEQAGADPETPARPTPVPSCACATSRYAPEGESCSGALLPQASRWCCSATRLQRKSRARTCSSRPEPPSPFETPSSSPRSSDSSHGGPIASRRCGKQPFHSVAPALPARSQSEWSPRSRDEPTTPGTDGRKRGRRGVRLNRLRVPSAVAGTI